MTPIRRITRIAAVATTVLALAAALAAPGPVSAATSRPHTPVGPFLRTDDLTAPQSCRDGAPVSRSLTPAIGVSSGAPTWNTDRPDLAATFEVAPAGRPVVARGTVRFDGSPATYRVPAGALGDGEYRFRVRAVDGTKTSDWLPWCSFTVETDDIAVPSPPTALRVSAHSYAGFQRCGGGATPVIYAGLAPTFAASPAAGSPGPNTVARFEVAGPGLETIVVAGNPYGVSVPGASFSPGGSYQFRVRFEEGPVVSGWSPWCVFTAAVTG